MDELFWWGIGLFGLLLLVAPVVGLVMAVDLRRQVRRLELRLGAMERELFTGRAPRPAASDEAFREAERLPARVDVTAAPPPVSAPPPPPPQAGPPAPRARRRAAPPPAS
jgi:hypothetical protein